MWPWLTGSPSASATRTTRRRSRVRSCRCAGGGGARRGRGASFQPRSSRLSCSRSRARASSSPPSNGPRGYYFRHGAAGSCASHPPRRVRHFAVASLANMRALMGLDRGGVVDFSRGDRENVENDAARSRRRRRMSRRGFASSSLPSAAPGARGRRCRPVSWPRPRCRRFGSRRGTSG